MGNIRNIANTLGIEEEIVRKWRKEIPPPYADRLYLSKWGELKVEPKFVLTEEGLIIFKTFHRMAKHFGKLNEWTPEMRVLPECESAYLIRHFPKFISHATLSYVQRYCPVPPGFYDALQLEQ